MDAERYQEYDLLLREARGLLMDARVNTYNGGDTVTVIDKALSKIVLARTMLLKYA